MFCGLFLSKKISSNGRFPANAAEWFARCGIKPEYYFPSGQTVLGSANYGITSLNGIHLVFEGWLEDPDAPCSSPSRKSSSEIIFSCYRASPDLYSLGQRNGIFSGALWDSDEGKIVLFRDPLGAKPVYYAWTPEGLVFADRIAGLLAYPGMKKRADRGMIGQYLAGEFLDYSTTFFEGIFQLPPAHILTLRPESQPEVKRYWQPESIQPQISINSDDAHQKFFELFSRAVRLRMHAAHPTGLLLSGGLDSAQVCAAAETLRASQPAPPAFFASTLVPEGFLAEEMEAIEALQKKFQTPVTFIDYAKIQKEKSVFELFLDQGETPHLDGFLTTEVLMKSLSAQGCRALLTGFGANELSNPMEMGYLSGLFLNHRYRSWGREVKQFSETIQVPLCEAIKTSLVDAMIESAPWILRRGIRQLRNQRRLWIHKDFLPYMPDLPPLRLRPFKSLPANRTYQYLFEPLIPLALCQMDEAAQANHMSAGHPFLDFRLISFFLSVPDEIKMELGFRKRFVQESLRPIMPIPVRARDDNRCWRSAGDLEERHTVELRQLKKHLHGTSEFLDSFLNYAELRRIMGDAQSVTEIGYPLLWRFARLGVWLKQNF